MRISEIFTSIQGESTRAGLPCTFIRLAGCNLRCSYCDTKYAYGEGFEVSIDEIVRKTGVAGLPLVEITGGEPLLQSETFTLTESLCERGYEVLIETNGSVSIKGIDSRASIILDVKTPGSGMDSKMDAGNLNELRKGDEIKFVITGREDYEWSKSYVDRYDLAGKTEILISPAFGLVSPESLARWMVEDKLKARLNLQIHKYIFGPEKRGV